MIFYLFILLTDMELISASQNMFCLRVFCNETSLYFDNYKIKPQQCMKNERKVWCKDKEVLYLLCISEFIIPFMISWRIHLDLLSVPGTAYLIIFFMITILARTGAVLAGGGGR